MPQKKFKFYALKLCGIIIVVYVLQAIFDPWFTDLFLLDQHAWLMIWKFVTAIFLHAGILHLLYNLLGLGLFGSILEKFIGETKFLRVFFVSGILANVIAVNFYQYSLGASGAIFGIALALVVIRPWQVIWIPPQLPLPVIIAAVFWVILDVIGSYAYLSGNPINQTGSVAHLSGMLFGLILGIYYRVELEKKKKLKLITKKARA